MPAMDYEKIAHLYDAYVQSDFDFSFFVEQTKRSSGEVLELMAGTGRLSLPLLEAGVNLTCVDSSPSMLNILRKKLQAKNIKANIVEADICQLFLNKEYDLILIPFHSFAEITNPNQQRQALHTVYNHLSNQGRFICTLHNPAVRLRNTDGNQRLLGKFDFENGEGILFLWSLESFVENKNLVIGYQFYEVYDMKGQLVSKSFLDLTFYVHYKQNFELLLQNTGFKVVSLYGDYAYGKYDEKTSPVMIWILKK